MTFCALWLCVASLPAQTPAVSFTGVQTTIPINLTGVSYPPNPSAIALDGAGNIYITDSGTTPAGSSQICNPVAKLPPGGGTYTLLPTPAVCSPIMTVDPAGNVWFVDNPDHLLVQVSPSGAVTQVTIAATVLSMTSDFSGNVYYSTASGTYQIQAGTTVAMPFSSIPGTAMAVDPAGNFFYASTADAFTVIKAPAGCTSLSCTTLVTRSTEPRALAADRLGDFYIGGNNPILEFTAGGSQLSYPPVVWGLAVNDKGEIFALNSGGILVLQTISADFYNVPVSQSHTLTLNFSINSGVTLAGSPSVVTQGTPGLDFTLSSTTCTGAKAAGSSCSVTVSFSPLAPGLRLGAVQLMDSSGNVLVTTPLRGVGTGPAVFFPGGPQTQVGQSWESPYDVAVDAAGNVFVSQIDEVWKIPAGCTGSGCQSLVAFGLSVPQGLAIDGTGALLIGDPQNNRLLKVPANCSVPACQTTVGTVSQPTGVALDGAGNIFISDSTNQRIVEARDNCTGSSCQTTLISGLNAPAGLALSGSNDLFIASPSANQVLKFPQGCTLGSCEALLANGLAAPTGVAVNAGGDAFLTNDRANQVLEAPPGCIGLPAPCGIQVSSGMNPYGVTTDAVGDVFIVDAGVQQVIELTGRPAISLSFPSTLMAHQSSPQTFTLQNIGNAPMQFAGISASVNFGVDPGSTTCQSSLAPGASCNVGVVCAPTVAGSLIGTLTLTDNTLNQVNAAQTVSLSCQGIGLPLPTVTFTGAPASAAYQSTFTVSATTNASVMPVITASGGCSVSAVTGTPAASAATVTMTSSTVTCSLTASWAYDLNYGPATASRSTLPAPATPSVTFTGAPKTTQYLTTFTVAATSTGDTTAVITASGACTVSGTTVTMTSGTGNCVLTATWAADSNYAAATLSQTTSALPAGNTAVFGPPLPPSLPYNATLAGTAGSRSTSVPVISISGQCSYSISGASFTFTMTSGNGLCDISAVFPPDSNWGPASLSATVAAVRAAPAVTFTGAPASAASGTSFNVTATTNSTTTAVITASGSCSISGTTVTMTSGAGNCVLTATWLADNSYAGATLSQTTTLPAKATPAVTFTGAPATANYQSTFTVASTTNASTTAVITAGGACSISGATVTMTAGTGNCVLTATWAADSNYVAATLSQTAAAAKATPAVTFTGAPASAAFGTSFNVTAATNASATAVLAASGACSISGATVTMTSGTGACSLTATWAADTNYVAATLSQTTAAAKATPTVTFTGAPAGAASGVTFNVTATTNASTTAVITASGACSISGTTVTMTSGTGSCVLTATWAADSNYGAATLSQTTVAAKIAPAVTFTGAPATANYQSTFTVASATNAGSTAVITAGGACSISGATVTMTSGTGACSLTATWAANANYNTATATQSTTANKIAPTVTFTGAPASAGSGVSFNVAAVTNASAAAVITASGACSVAGSTVTMTSNTGACQLTATWAADSNYVAASATQSTQSTATVGSLINALLTMVNGLPPGLSLKAQVQALAMAVQNNNMNVACSDLTTFINHVNAQSGQQITTAQAQQILALAAEISAMIGCSK